MEIKTTEQVIDSAIAKAIIEEKKLGQYARANIPVMEIIKTDKQKWVSVDSEVAFLDECLKLINVQTKQESSLLLDLLEKAIKERREKLRGVD